MIVKRSRNNRRAVLATLLTGSIVLSATGCSNSPGSRFASLNPFSKPKPTATQTQPGVTDSIAQGTKSLWKRSGEAVSGVFAADKEAEKSDEAGAAVDPLRLDRKSQISPEVLVANGRLWESTGNMQKAMENYTKALELEADYPDALTNIARLHFRQGNHTQAADFFGRAIKKNPKDAGLYNDLGLTLSKMGDHKSAEQMLSRALELSPGTSRYANNLASVKYESNDQEGAYKVLEANNKPAVAHFNMAYLHYKSGKMQDAQKHLAQVMQFAPQAVQDDTVKQAVDRSREMLAQITTPQAPQATIAQAPPLPGGKMPASGIRQTSQSAASDAKAAVAPAAGPATMATQDSVRPSIGIQQVNPSTALEPGKETAAEPAKANPSELDTSAKMDARATSETIVETTEAQTAPAADPFALPPSFQMPTP
jgi:Flp pilus assembly protein TadD